MKGLPHGEVAGLRSDCVGRSSNWSRAVVSLARSILGTHTKNTLLDALQLMSFASLDFAGKTKRTKRDVFLAEMAAMVRGRSWKH